MNTTTLKEPAKPSVIVMAEDDLDDRLLIKDALAETNWPADLRFVDNGEEMMAYLSRNGKYADPAASPRPTLILLDLNMPRKDGREVLREVKTRSDLKQIPVVV